MISHIEDTNITTTHTFISWLPRIYPLGYDKAWMEGDIFETGFIDKFKHDFRDKTSQWLSMTMQEVLKASDIQEVYNKLEAEDTLAHHFVLQFVASNITPGGAAVYITSINVSSNEERYNISKGNLGTFEQISSSTLPAADVEAVSLNDMASLITTKEDGVENTRSKKGFIR